MTTPHWHFYRFTNAITQGLILALFFVVSPVRAQDVAEPSAPTGGAPATETPAAPTIDEPSTPDEALPDNAIDAVEAPAIDAFADQLLLDLGDYIDSAEQYTFDAEVVVDEQASWGQKVQYAYDISVAVHQPDRLYTIQTGDLYNRTIWFDGSQFTRLDRDLNHFVTVDTPDFLAEGIPYLENLGVVFSLSDFVTGNFYEGVTEKLNTGRYLGLHRVRGELCHHLAFTQDNIDWQIWIQDGSEIVPCKLIITYKNLPGEPQYTAYFSNWNFSPRLPERLFIPVVPRDAAEIPYLRRP